MIFLDTSAIYAWTDRNDMNHKRAVEFLQEILNRTEPILTHNYVLLEAFTLLQARLGPSAALNFSKDSVQFEVDWVDNQTHTLAVTALQMSGKRRVSLVDHVSFLVMRRRNLKTAFAFDPHFEAEGFRLFEI
jgi:uncharacterized protein